MGVGCHMWRYGEAYVGRRHMWGCGDGEEACGEACGDGGGRHVGMGREAYMYLGMGREAYVGGIYGVHGWWLRGHMC